MKKHVIIAPHADDEIIGCYNVLYANKVKMVLFPHYNPKAVEEAKRSAQTFGFEAGLVQDHRQLTQIALSLEADNGCMFFPDPFNDYHPQHKQIGMMGFNLFQDRHKNIVFYNTNMNAPYIRESPYPGKKRDALNLCYDDKSSLWKYDHKYFLFEGQVEFKSERSWLVS